MVDGEGQVRVNDLLFGFDGLGFASGTIAAFATTLSRLARSSMTNDMFLRHDDSIHPINYTHTMSFPLLPEISKTRLNECARQVASGVINGEDYRNAVDMVNAWRTAHAYPLNTFTATLRNKTKRYDGVIVAQRLKRLPTIIDKLQRQPHMDLTRMQDIGGVRAIVVSMHDLENLRQEYTRKMRFGHELYDIDDYVAVPKSDGYRSIHLVYKYNNTLARSGNASHYKGLFVEVQLRTILQHEWATAVEAVGIMLNQQLKTQRGSAQWLEFFEYMSSIFAIIENAPVMEKHKHLDSRKIIDTASKYITDAKIIDALTGWKRAVELIDKHHIEGHYNLIVLDAKSQQVRIRPYAKSSLEAATKEYTRLEQDAAIDPNIDVVLVAAGGIKQLKAAYPNYFLDIQHFINRVKDVVRVTSDDI